MRLFFSFLKLIRPANLFFIVLTQFLFYFCILVPVLHKAGSLPSISIWQLALVSAASVLIAAAGYIINDYFDVDIDHINKPQGNVVDAIISRRWAILWHFVLSGLGVLVSVYLSWKTGLWYIVVANFACVFLLFAYSVSLKRKLLSGNILISILTAWVVLVLCLSEFSLTVTDALLHAQNEVMKLGFLYAGFAFITTLVREAVKDMEDVEGDGRFGCKTMPIVWGIPATKVYVAVWLIVLICVLVVIQVYIIRFHWWLPIAYSLLLVILPSLFIFRKLFKATTRSEFHYLSNLNKLLMLMGILSMGFFYFYL